MTTDLEQGVGDLMETLQAEPATLPPVADIRQAAHQKTLRVRAGVGLLTLLVMAPISMWAWTNISNPDSVVTASQDETGGEEVEPTPQIEPAEDLPTVVPLVDNVDAWMDLNNYVQNSPDFRAVRLVGTTSDTGVDVTIDLSSQLASPPDTLSMFIFVDCFHSLARGSLIVEEGNTRFVEGFFPVGVQSDLGDAQPQCEVPPRSAELDTILAEPFELQLGDGTADLVGATTTIKLAVSPPGN